MRHVSFLVLPLLLLPTLALAEGEDPAGIARDVMACESLGFGTCGALSAAMPQRDAVAAALAGMLKTATPAEQAKIALALSLLDAKTQVDALNTAAEVLATDPAAADLRSAQARLGDVRAAPALVAMLQTDDVRRQILAAGGLGILHHKPAVTALVERLRSGQTRVQAAAASALGQIGSPEAEPELLNLAAAPKTLGVVRAAALNALALLHSRKAVPLATMLVDATPRDVARAALRVLTAVPTPWAEDAALNGLDTPGARAEAAGALVALKMTSAGVRVLETAVRDDIEPDERIALQAAIVALKPSSAAPILVKRLNKLPLNMAPDEALRILRLLPQLGDRSVVPDLVPLLRLDNKFVVNHVVFALENLTGLRHGADEKPWLEYVAKGADGKTTK